MFDLHTHNSSFQPDAIVNCDLDADFSLYPRFSVGIHPWKVDADWKKNMYRLKMALTNIESGGMTDNLAAIGEIGLDKVKGGDIRMQMGCLEEQLQLAETMQKPVILHCVKAMDEMLGVLKKYDNLKHVIFHGFRGKPLQAEQLMSKGYYLSFGIRFNEESLRLAYSHGRMFLETDDSGLHISDVYNSASKALHISPTDISVPGIFTS